MPSLILKKSSKHEDKHLEPVALVKAEEGKKPPLHNSFLYIDKSDHPTEGSKKVTLPLDCRFELTPSTKSRDRRMWCMCGPSGVGKSHLASQIAINCLKLFPDRQMHLVSKLTQDDTIDRVPGLQRLDHENFVFEEPDVNTSSNGLVMFDDIDSIDHPHYKAIHKFVDDVATMGRSHHSTQGGVSMMYTTLSITNYRLTRLLLLESHYKMVFPLATNAHSLNYTLKKHVGMNKGQIAGLKKIGGRFALVHSFYPNFMITKCTANFTQKK